MDRIQTFAVDFGDGSKQPVINGLPKRGTFGPYYLKRVDFRLHLEIDQDAVAVAVTGRRMMEAISTILLAPSEGLPLINNLHAQSLRMIQWPLTMRAPLDPADVAANPGGAGATTTVDIPFTVPFEDKRKKQPKDGGVPLQFVSLGALTINWVSEGFFGAGVTIGANTRLYINFVYEERFETDVGERITYEEVAITGWDSQPIPPGQVTDVLLAPTTGATSKAYDENSFASLSFDEDGDRILNNVKPDDSIHAFNEEMITDILGALPTMDAAQTEFIPIVWPGRDATDMGDHAFADGGFQLQANIGSGDPPTNDSRFVVRRVLPQAIADQAAQVAAASTVNQGVAQLGLQVANKAPKESHGIIKAATNSKVPLSMAHSGAAEAKNGRYGRYMRRTVNPGALSAAARAAAQAAEK